MCGRCIKARKVCTGFRDSARNVESGTVESAALVTEISWGPVTTDSGPGDQLEYIRLSRLGCEILHKDAPQPHGPASSFWNCIPMLGQTDRLVSASMAALGASIEVTSFLSRHKLIVYAKFYANALDVVQQYLVEAANPSTTLIVACLLLAVCEITMGQELAALSHIQGTLLLLQRRQISMTPNVCAGQNSWVHCQFALNDSLDFAGAVIDIGTASYALSLNPRLHLVTGARKQHCSSWAGEQSCNERRILQTLHSSYAFASQHFQWRYPPDKFVPTEAFIAQNRLCAALFHCIQELGSIIDSMGGGQTAREFT